MACTNIARVYYIASSRFFLSLRQAHSALHFWLFQERLGIRSSTMYYRTRQRTARNSTLAYGERTCQTESPGDTTSLAMDPR